MLTRRGVRVIFMSCKLEERSLETVVSDLLALSYLDRIITLPGWISRPLDPRAFQRPQFRKPFILPFVKLGENRHRTYRAMIRDECSNGSV